jgi:hypothetical protein
VVERERLQEGFGGQSCPSREQLLKPRGLNVHASGDRLQGRLVAPVFRQEFNHLPHDAVIVRTIWKRV